MIDILSFKRYMSMYIQAIEYAIKGHIYREYIPTFTDYTKTSYSYYVELAYKMCDGVVFYNNRRIENVTVLNDLIADADAYRIYYYPIVGIKVYPYDVNGGWEFLSSKIALNELPKKQAVEKVNPSILVNHISGFYDT